jgi:hypothetical protein
MQRKNPSASDEFVNVEDYELDLVDGVEDEAEKEQALSERFSITSYGADYTVDSIVKRMNTAAFYAPPFQRSYVWSQRHASRFVESLLLGLPVPGIFLFKEVKSGRHIIVDGQQRLKTLQFFFSGLFNEKRFRLIDVNQQWADRDIHTIDAADRLRLEDAIIHATIFQQEEPRGKDDSIYYVFERINTGGIRLSPQEIRICVNYGPFAQALDDMNKIEAWRKIYGNLSRRSKDQELILRFLALYFGIDRYSRPMGIFLNNFMEENREATDDQIARYTHLFKKTIELVNISLGLDAFRPERALNTAVFDAVMVGLARRLEMGNVGDKKTLVEKYNELLSNKRFQQAYIRATADAESVKSRIKLASEAFQDLR